MYNAFVSFVNTEWVEGAREGGQSCTSRSDQADEVLRNKLSFDLAHLFIDAYPSHIPSFLHPFFPLLQSDQPDPVYLVIHLFEEIALEIHDSTMRSARLFSQTRFLRDGNIRDSIRSSGDEALAVQGMLGVAQRAIDQGGKWLEVGELAIKTLATWTRKWCRGVTDSSLGRSFHITQSPDTRLLPPAPLAHRASSICCGHPEDIRWQGDQGAGRQAAADESAGHPAYSRPFGGGDEGIRGRGCRCVPGGNRQCAGDLWDRARGDVGRREYPPERADGRTSTLNTFEKRQKQ